MRSRPKGGVAGCGMRGRGATLSFRWGLSLRWSCPCGREEHRGRCALRQPEDERRLAPQLNIWDTSPQGRGERPSGAGFGGGRLPVLPPACDPAFLCS
jgi:hypothetical protein